MYLSFFSLSFRFILWSVGTAKSTILQIFFFFLLIIIIIIIIINGCSIQLVGLLRLGIKYV